MENEQIYFRELQPGMTLQDGKYIIEKVLGAGGFGITYYARHTSLDQHYAIKEFFIDGRCVRNTMHHTVNLQGIGPEMFEKYRKKFTEEAQTLAKLDHPNIVRVIDVFEENETSYIVMPFIEGKTLESLVEKNGPLDYGLSINYIGQIASAVGYIHKRNILHRDIKPDNIMITDDNHAILIDFGSAREFIQDKTQHQTSILTKGYAPIEQYSSNSRKGAYTDIYSLGAVLYYVLTSTKPMDATERLSETMPEPKEINPQIGENVNRTIMKAMQLKHENRHQTIDEFMQDLLGQKPSAPINEEKVIVDAPKPQIILTNQASPVNAPQPIAPKSNRSKGLIIGIVVAIILALGGVGAWMIKVNNDKAEMIARERGEKIHLEICKTCDRYIADLNERNILDKLDLTVEELRKLERFEDKSPYASYLRIKFSQEKMKSFMGKLTDIKENLENSLITTYVDFDHNGVIYQTVLRKIKRIDAVFSDIQESEEKSAQNIHIKSDEL